MAHDLFSRGPPDGSRVDLSGNQGVQYWTHKFGVTEQKLRKLIATTGSSIKAVEKALRH